MAAEWYYVIKGQQSGPVELQTLREMLGANSLSSADLVFGPGLTEWIPAGQAPALSASAPTANAAVAVSAVPLANTGGMLAYRGVETAATGLSDVAMHALKQTKPWARFVAIMTFIAAGFMVIAGLGIFGMTAFAKGAAGVPAFLGIVYLVMGALYIVPGVLLNRYASGIASLMLSQRMADVEYALGAQKSFWKFVGIMIIAVIALYVGVIVFIVVMKGRF